MKLLTYSVQIFVHLYLHRSSNVPPSLFHRVHILMRQFLSWNEADPSRPIRRPLLLTSTLAVGQDPVPYRWDRGSIYPHRSQKGSFLHIQVSVFIRSTVWDRSFEEWCKDLKIEVISRGSTGKAAFHWSYQLERKKGLSRGSRCRSSKGVWFARSCFCGAWEWGSVIYDEPRVSFRSEYRNPVGFLTSTGLYQ